MLIIAVLLQPGKTDAGALFTSNISSSALNPRGTQSVLSKLTIVMAATFMLSALLLSLPAITGKVSVLETQGETPAAPANTGSADANSANVQEGAAPAEANKGAESPKPEEKPADKKEEGSAESGDAKKDSE